MRFYNHSYWHIPDGSTGRRLRARTEGTSQRRHQGRREDGQDVRRARDRRVLLHGGPPVPRDTRRRLPRRGPRGAEVGLFVPHRGQEQREGRSLHEQIRKADRTGGEDAGDVREIPHNPDIRVPSERGQRRSVEDIHPPVGDDAVLDRYHSEGTHPVHRHQQDRELHHAVVGRDEAFRSAGFHRSGTFRRRPAHRDLRRRGGRLHRGDRARPTVGTHRAHHGSARTIVIRSRSRTTIPGVV